MSGEHRPIAGTGRGAIAGLASPDPIGQRLPGIYAEDELTQRLTSAFDEVMAPVHATLDNLWAYFDPALAPDDFVDWLAGWVAADLDRDAPIADRRTVLASAGGMHRRRGTAAAIADEIELTFGVVAEVVDTGGTTWSSTSGTALPGLDHPSVMVRVRVAEPAAFPVARLRALVEAIRPTHVAYQVEVLPADQDRDRHDRQDPEDRQDREEKR